MGYLNCLFAGRILQLFDAINSPFCYSKFHLNISLFLAES
jgi:hypothetical protein